jgi:hypothetical protein
MIRKNELLNKKKDIAKANLQLKQYHLSFEQSPGLLFECEIDRVGRQQYIKTNGEGFKESEIIWIQDKGFGRRLGSDRWFKLRGAPIPDYMKFAIALIDDHFIGEVREEDQNLIAELVVNMDAEPITAYKKLFSEVFKMLKVRKKEYVSKIAEVCYNLSLNISISISKENFLFKEINTKVIGLDFDARFNISFNESIGVFKRLSTKERRAATFEIPTSALLYLQIPSIGGWTRKNHCEFALRTIELIKANDIAGSYSEIYDPVWEKLLNTNSDTINYSNHPIVIGADYEDVHEIGLYDKNGKKINSIYHDLFSSDPNYSPNNPYYFSNAKYERDVNHYGGEEIGVKYEWYFPLYTDAKPTQPNDRYYSAKNGGYGGSQVNNRLTFTEAIKQYNRYSLDGKRCSLLMLGHVLHLLQDQGQPDHAELVVHAASSNNEKEAYETFYTCWVLAAEIVGILTPDLFADAISGDTGALIMKSSIFAPIFFAALASCLSTVNTYEVGYEKLIREKYNFSKKTKKFDTLMVKDPKPFVSEVELNLTQPLYQDTYDNFFKQMALKSLAIRNSIKAKYPNEDLLNCPLGLSPYPVIVPQVPGCNPDINSNSVSHTMPFFEMTNEILKYVICYGAGFVQRFYEIVNHPPYVEQVTIVKAVSGLNPVDYAKFDSSLYFPECKKCKVRYNAKWNHQPGASKRTLSVNSEPLSPDHRAYVFIRFGPNLDPCGYKMVRPETLKLELIGKTPNNTTEKILVNLTAAKDKQSEWYYWGSFQPRNPWGKNYELTLNITAKDASAHFMNRTQSGDELDSRPETIARVDSNNAPLYPFINYKPDVDRNHKIEIATEILADKWEANQTIPFSSPVRLELAKAPLNNPNFQVDKNPDEGAAFYPSSGENALTLHTPNDVDFFHVQFKTHPNDKNMISGLTKSFFGGIFLESFSPRLEIQVEETYGGCLNLQLYDAQTVQKFVFHNTKGANIDRPQDIFPGNHFYLAVRNPDYSKQGKLRYGLFIRYHCGGFLVKGELLYKLFEYMGLPWQPPEWWNFPWDPDLGPPIPPELTKQFDPEKIITYLNGFLPELIKDLGIKDQVERDLVLACERYELGQLAHSAGLLDDAELLYNESINVFRKLKLGIREADVLFDLQALYTMRGKLKDDDPRI